jgi:hypothetical protein
MITPTNPVRTQEATAEQTIFETIVGDTTTPETTNGSTNR